MDAAGEASEFHRLKPGAVLRSAGWGLLIWGLLPAPRLAAAERLVNAPLDSPYHVWPSEPPPDCPFQRSTAFRALAFTGRHAGYTGADTWYPSWASDGNLYSPWTDGNVNGLGSNSAGTNATTGFATILGDDPMHLVVTNQGTVVANPQPYGGRYPCGSLVHNGVWYYGTYCLMNENGSLEGMVKTDQGDINWGILGPFVGFRTSTNLGRTWTETSRTPSTPLFPEPAQFAGPVRIGSPHFVDLGRNLEHSPDGRAYLVAHGAVIPDPQPRIANASWITGDALYLLRVRPTPDTINDPAQYEFFAGHDPDGRPRWTSEFARIKPLLEWNNHLGCATMTYDAPLKKYLLCVTDGGNTVSRYQTLILESDRMTGPWRLVVYLKDFGEQAYFVNVPSKFISSDGRTFWICYAANFTNGWLTDYAAWPPGGRYGMILQEVNLLRDDEPIAAADPLWSRDNLALQARVTAASVHPDYAARGAVDRAVGGFPGDIRKEWATDGEQDTAVIRLSWRQPRTIDRVWLFDRPNTLDQITSGLLVFSDGTTLKTGALPDDAKQGLEVSFPPKTVTWLAFLVTGARSGTQNVGLAEIAVFAAK